MPSEALTAIGTPPGRRVTLNPNVLPIQAWVSAPFTVPGPCETGA